MFLNMPQVALHHGDCASVLAGFGDSSVDAIVTDPPYGLSAPPDIAEVLRGWLTVGDYEHAKPGFMGKQWDAFVPGPHVWKECLRVLKPGGHLVAFAGCRTQDLMSVSLRLGGFEVRETIMWLFGQGFPKSLDVAKAIDRAGGRDAKESAARLKAWRTAVGLSRAGLAELVGCTAASVRDWEEGRVRTSGHPAEFVVPAAQYQTRLNELCEYGVDARAVTGRTQGRAGDGSVIGLGHTGAIYGPPSSDLAADWAGWGTALKPAYEPVLLCRKPLAGTVANTVLSHGTGALNIAASRVGSDRFPANIMFTHHYECVEVGTKQVPNDGHYPSSRGSGGLGTAGHAGQDGLAERAERTESVEAWDCHPDCPIRTLDGQSGMLKSGKPGRKWKENTSATYGAESRPPGTMMPGFGDSGGASRFFYCAKASKRERNAGVDGTNGHPTVKPVALMEYLVRLITPPGGVVLDPYCGSGTTLVAATRLGFDSIGIDRDDEGTYLPVVEQRVIHVGADVDRPADAA